jgi:hypothetical protein
MKPKKCNVCKTKFEPMRPLQMVCSPICALNYTKNQKAKQWGVEKRKIKYKLQTKGDLEKLLQIEINKLIRLIDYGNTCISCGGNGKEQAGHYHTTKAKPAIRYNLFNIFLQCYYCNVELSSNIVGYNKGLRATFGEDLQEYIEIELPKINYLGLSKIDLAEKTTLLRKLIREYEPKPLTTSERIEVREYFQKKIAIYQN